MGESYTIGGDTWASYKWHKLEGQTFRVQAPFFVQYLDVDLDKIPLLLEPTFDIYYADAHHEPTGSILSHGRQTRRIAVHKDPEWRVRYKMSRFLLEPGITYVIVSRYMAGIFFRDLDWRYDKSNATYKYGMRISSDDDGVTWTKHYNDDHMFALFGDPPSPTPQPDPPMFNWFGLTIQYVRTETGLKIITSTNVPCHMHMYWTHEPPRKHVVPRFRRGTQFSDILDYCFVAWHENEQEEAGDTDYHTFIKEPWEDCETRWFCFRATIAGMWSPSTSPIFEKHRKTPIVKTFYAQPDNRTIQNSHAAWATCHDASSGTIPANWDTPWYVIQAGENLTVSYWIWRGFLAFNTYGVLADLPRGAMIEGASLDIFCYQKLRTSSIPYPNFCLTQGVQSIPVVTGDYGSQLEYSEIGGKKDFDSFVVDQYNSIPFDWNGFKFINIEGLTKLCLRGEQDTINRPPPLGTNWCLFYSQQKGVDSQPRLTIQCVTP